MLYSIADSPLIDNPHRILVTADSTVKSSPYLCGIVITADATITEEYHRSRHPPRHGCYRHRRRCLIIMHHHHKLSSYLRRIVVTAFATITSYRGRIIDVLQQQKIQQLTCTSI